MATDTAVRTAGLLGEIPAAAYNEALTEAKAGRLTRARECLLFALELDDQSVSALVLMGKLCAQEDDLHAAVSYWDRALALQPDNAAAQRGMSKARQLLATSQLVQRLAMVGRVLAVFALVLLGYWSPTIYQRLAGSDATQAEAGVLQAWGTSPALCGLGLGVTATEGECLLRGSVPTAAHRDLAVALAKTASDGAVNPSGLVVALPSPGEAITRLCADASCEWMREIRTEPGVGQVRISGLVPTAEDREWLVTLARQIAGTGSEQLDAKGLVVLSPVETRLGRGDTLWGLAERYYGDGRRWPEIRAANPALPRDPRRIPTDFPVQVVLDRHGPIPACLKVSDGLPAASSVNEIEGGT